MKRTGTLLLLLALVLILTLGACSDGDSDDPNPTAPVETTATLVYAHRMANADRAQDAAPTKAAVHGGQILDTRHARLKIEVAQGTVTDGQPDTCSWIEIYDSHEEIRDSDRVFAPVSLPVGVYDNLRLTTDSDHAIWECAFGAEVVDIQAATTPVAVFGDGGLFGYVDGSSVLTSLAAGERLGGFEILAGVTTYLTFVSNLDSLSWDDADGSGDWSDGDSLDDVTGVPGTDTMGGFVAQYVEN